MTWSASDLYCSYIFTAKYSVEELKEQQDLTDWNRVDAMTDEDIVKAVASDPDIRILDENDFKNLRPTIRQLFSEIHSLVIEESFEIDLPDRSDRSNSVD